MMRSVVDAQLQGIVIDSTIHPIESTSFKISYSSSGTIDANVASSLSSQQPTFFMQMLKMLNSHTHLHY